MNRNGKIIFGGLLIALACSFAYTYYVIVVQEQYVTFTNEDDIPTATDYLKEKLWTN